MKKLRVFFVNMEYPPISGPGIWRILGFSRHLNLLGHDVHVICSNRSSWHDLRDETLLDRVPDSIKITRLKCSYLRDMNAAFQRRIDRSHSGWRRSLLHAIQWRLNRWWPDPAFFWALKAAFSAVLLARKERPDVIITSGPPHLSHFAGLICQKWTKTQWIMDYRDPWTAEGYRDQIIDGPYQHAFFSRIEKYFLGRADAVVSVSPSWTSLLREKISEGESRFHLIRNGHNLDSSAECMRVEEPSRDDGRCWIHFNGTIQTGSDLLLEIAQALAYLRDEVHIDVSRFLFTFCGIPDSFWVSQEIAGLEDIFVDLGYLPYFDSIQKSVNADALLLLVSGGNPIVNGLIPGKAYEQMALGKYILALLPINSDTRTLLIDYPLVTISDDLSSDSISHALKKILTEFDRLDGKFPVLPADERSLYFNAHSRAFHSTQLFDLIESLDEIDKLGR